MTLEFTRLVDTTAFSALRPDRGTAVRIANAGIALFLVEGRVVAVEDDCLQCGRPISGNEVRGRLLSCGGCGWTYDLATAAVARMPSLHLNQFTARVVGDRVLIEWPLAPA
jgi:nitrite reductase/ring-hydroxylating ferredoxin subunit